ncbi:MAG: glycosyltransferase, partial [Mucinivorans sp.]
MKKQILILMATYNGEKYIKEQIESLLNQSNKNWDLLISDD